MTWKNDGMVAPLDWIEVFVFLPPPPNELCVWGTNENGIAESSVALATHGEVVSP